jgi:hypothetical protein
MGPADDVEGAAKASSLFAKYGTREEHESAREKLAARLEQPAKPAEAPRPTREQKKAAEAAKRGGDVLGDFLGSRTGKSIQREIVRGVFDILRRKL